jgi:cytoskeleton protein RodZ
VCVVNAKGRRLVDGQTLAAGQRSGPYTARRLRVTFGNSSVRMRVGGKTYPVTSSPDPIGYALRPGHAPRPLSAAQRPVCA